ncbi:hypothetical protein HDU79_007867, partial [Rhizoclosmatium sp. JEL0117]
NDHPPSCNMMAFKKELAWVEISAQEQLIAHLNGLYATNMLPPRPLLSFPTTQDSESKINVAMEEHKMNVKFIQQRVAKQNQNRNIQSLGLDRTMVPLQAAMNFEEKLAQNPLNLNFATKYKVSSKLVLKAKARGFGKLLDGTEIIMGEANVDRLQYYRYSLEAKDLKDGGGAIGKDGEYPFFGSIEFHVGMPGFKEVVTAPNEKQAYHDIIAVIGAVIAQWQADVLNPRGPLNLRKGEVQEYRLNPIESMKYYASPNPTMY